VDISLLTTTAEIRVLMTRTKKNKAEEKKEKQSKASKE